MSFTDPDGEAYSLPWLKRYRASVYATMQRLARGAKEGITQRRRRATLAKLVEKASKLRAEIKENCGHALELQRYKEEGREDTLGNWRRGSDMRIWCEGCGATLAEWSD